MILLTLFCTALFLLAGVGAVHLKRDFCKFLAARNVKNPQLAGVPLPEVDDERWKRMPFRKGDVLYALGSIRVSTGYDEVRIGRNTIGVWSEYVQAVQRLTDKRNEDTLIRALTEETLKQLESAK